jgi:chemotaxis protein CheD
MAEPKTYHLEPGFVFAAREHVTIRTVLGSCVAVSLWDRALCYGGMNHFLYPAPGENEELTPRFGVGAIPALIRMMKELGSRRKNIEAQIFGGASQWGYESSTTGERNQRIARDMLQKYRLPIVSEDVGGYRGRKILFDTASGHVAVLKVHQLRQEDWAPWTGKSSNNSET